MKLFRSFAREKTILIFVVMLFALGVVNAGADCNDEFQRALKVCSEGGSGDAGWCWAAAYESYLACLSGGERGILLE